MPTEARGIGALQKELQAGSCEPPDVGTGKPTGSSAGIDALNC